LAFFFSLGSTALVATSLSILRGVRQGLLAGLAMAATPILYLQGASQAADVPLAFYRLATVVAMAIADRFDNRGFAVLAGAAAGFAGWTKNEGLLWFGAFLIARLIATRFRLLAEFLAGAAPALASILLFKARIATASDIFGATGRMGMADRFLDPARYALVSREVLRHMWDFGPLLLSPFVILAVYLAVVGIRADDRDRATLRTAIPAILLTAAGSFLIYVLRPLDLAWLLDSSLDRVLLQFWPSIVFIVFLAGRAPERA
jgi:hypothetical protein